LQKLQSEIIRLNNIPSVPTEISFDDFLEEFKPTPSCKKFGCYGRGFTMKVFQQMFSLTGRPVPIIGSTDNHKKQVNFCPCVWKQYLKSDKNYRIFLTLDNGQKEFLLI
jgi:hypothetical protein